MEGRERKRAKSALKKEIHRAISACGPFSTEDQDTINKRVTELIDVASRGEGFENFGDISRGDRIGCLSIIAIVLFTSIFLIVIRLFWDVLTPFF